ncbi:MAG: winged helix-turn-helix domain-containing protein [candidate division WOR-3 bacterium]
MGNKFIRKRPMLEVLYRESRVAKALGEPPKMAIVNLLLRRGPLTLSEIANSIHRSKTTTCYHLSKLKGLEIVRYETKENGVHYWIKYEREIREILNTLSKFVNRSLKGIYWET